MTRPIAVVAAALLALVADAAPKVERVASPAGAGAMAVHFCRTATGLGLSWIDGPSEGTHRLRFARLEKGAWTEPVSITESLGLVANWADTPSVTRGGDGVLVAHWAERSAEGSGGYDVVLARSTDEGRTWRRLGLANDDGTPAEHGFSTLVPDAKGVIAVWLDGRQTLDGGAMTLRAGPAGASPASQMLDARVCDCCGTAAAVTSDGPLVVYRDRSVAEVRDIFRVRRLNGKWSAPAAVSSDGWSITGCPVNGPAVAAAGEKVVVAWYTYAQSQPRVRVAFSADSGATFGRAIEVDATRGAVAPIGRVDVTIDAQGLALVSWMTASREEGEVLIRQVSPDGKLGPLLTIARTQSHRQSGFPRQERDGSDVVFAWTEPDGIQLARVALGTLPPPTREAKAVAEPTDQSAGVPPRSAPTLTVRTLDGAPATLAKLRGQAVLVNFWATWCEPCRTELPILSKLDTQHRARGLAVVGVSVDASLTPSEVKAFASRRGGTFPLWQDPQESLATAFGVQTLPASFLIDRAGNLVWSATGAIASDDAALALAIEKALGP